MSRSACWESDDADFAPGYAAAASMSMALFQSLADRFSLAGYLLAMVKLDKEIVTLVSSTQTSQYWRRLTKMHKCKETVAIKRERVNEGVKAHVHRIRRESFMPSGHGLRLCICSPCEKPPIRSHLHTHHRPDKSIKAPPKFSHFARMHATRMPGKQTGGGHSRPRNM